MSTQKISSLQDITPIVDADSHLTESVDDIIPHIESDGMREVFEGTHNPLSEIFTLSAASPMHLRGGDIATESSFTGEEGPEAKKDEMAEYGIDKGLINPSLCLAMPTVNNTRFAVEIAKAYNSWVLDEYGNHDEFKLTMVVPNQKPDKAAEEIDDRASEDAFSGIMLATSGMVPPLGHEWYHPLLQAAEDNDLPLVMHTTGGASTFSFPKQFRWAETFAEDHLITHPFTHMWNLTNMMLNGVPERFTDLEFVFQESGLAWVPYMKWRLDDHYLQYSHEIPGLDELPSEYIKDRFYFTTQPLGLIPDNPSHMASIIDMIGHESVIYSADLPHSDFDPPEELFNPIRSHLSDDKVRKVMGGNAEKLFDL